MITLFNHILSMSLTSCIVILVVFLTRFLVKKISYRMACLLWIIVAIRLVFPYAPESKLSIIPDKAVFVESTLESHFESYPQITYEETTDNGNEVNQVDESISKIVSSITVNQKEEQITVNPYLIIWSLGVAFMLLYGVLSSFFLHKAVSDGIRSHKNIYRCDRIQTPFIIGLITPRICIPYFLDNDDYKYVIAHEEAHIARLDHISKFIAFIILSLHWFNPLVWLAFMLFARDVEFACDEKVISQMTVADKKNYVNTLLSCTTHRYVVFSYPLYFGEIEVKERIKAIKGFRQPKKSYTFILSVICSLIAGSLLTNPIVLAGTDIVGTDTGIISLPENHTNYDFLYDGINSPTYTSELTPPDDSCVIDNVVFESSYGTITPLFYSFDGYRVFFTFDYQSESDSFVTISTPSGKSSLIQTSTNESGVHTGVVILDRYTPDIELSLSITQNNKSEYFPIQISLTNNDTVVYPINVDISSIAGEPSSITNIGISKSIVILDTTHIDASISELLNMTLITSNGEEIPLIDSEYAFGPLSTDNHIYCMSHYYTIFDEAVENIAAIVIENTQTNESIQINLND